MRSGTQEAEHEITVRAPAETVYRLLADVASWPRIFPPTVHVDHLERSDTDETIRIWATANGEAKSWVSHRTLRPEERRIDFAQRVSTPPVAEMSGTWLAEPAGPGTTRLRLLHHYRAVDDDPEGLAWIDTAVERNSRTELASLKTTIEQATDTAAGLTLSFTDTVWIDGSAKDVYDFINEADRWTERLPHVDRVGLTEDVPGLQVLEMDTRAKDGSTHTTKSVRVCFPHHLIVYKQSTLPVLLTLHTGYWDIEETDDGVRATAEHTVVLNPDTITQVLGAGAGPAKARAFVRDALGTNSRATLGHAKDHAERRNRPCPPP